MALSASLFWDRGLTALLIASSTMSTENGERKSLLLPFPHRNKAQVTVKAHGP